MRNERAEARQSGPPVDAVAHDLSWAGGSEGIRNVWRQADSVADRTCPVVLYGETGTGKDLIARRLHANSLRASGPFVPVDCTNLSADLFASQLFGHAKGAFTGADCQTVGFCRAAHGGTLFLDEIGELPVSLQAKFLRVLQDRCVTPLGETCSYPLDIRVICATNRDLADLVRKGAFREDLYYRISVVTITVPPLRERRGDILPLARYFLTQQAQLYDEEVKQMDPKVASLLLEYPWPGNVRELANVMEAAHVLTSGNTLSIASLPAQIVTGASDRPLAPFPTLAQAEQKLAREAMRYTHGRKMTAARLLGIDRRRLNRLIRRWDADSHAQQDA